MAAFIYLFFFLLVSAERGEGDRRARKGAAPVAGARGRRRPEAALGLGRGRLWWSKEKRWLAVEEQGRMATGGGGLERGREKAWVLDGEKRVYSSAFIGREVSFGREVDDGTARRQLRMEMAASGVIIGLSNSRGSVVDGGLHRCTARLPFKNPWRFHHRRPMESPSLMIGRHHPCRLPTTPPPPVSRSHHPQCCCLQRRRNRPPTTPLVPVPRRFYPQLRRNRLSQRRRNQLPLHHRHSAASVPTNSASTVSLNIAATSHPLCLHHWRPSDTAPSVCPTRLYRQRPGAYVPCAAAIVVSSVTATGYPPRLHRRF